MLRILRHSSLPSAKMREGGDDKEMDERMDGMIDLVSVLSHYAPFVGGDGEGWGWLDNGRIPPCRQRR